MKSDNTIEVGEDRSSDPELGAAGSVEDFIRELEEKEKDLHITAEMVIEVSESEFDDKNIPEFVTGELRSAKSNPTKTPLPATAAGQSRKNSEIVGLENTISKFKVERTEILERSRRQSEDFENYRKRTERDRLESLSAQMVNLAAKMLPVLDNLNRALDFAMAMPPEKRAEIEPFVDGIILVNQQVNEVLAEMGVSPIGAVGQTFDPHVHEAVATEHSVSHPPNTVSEELLRGYQLGNRVIRHSMVKVAASDESKSDPATGDGSGENLEE